MTLLGGKVTGRVFVKANDVTIDGIEVVGGNAPAQNGQIHVRHSESFTLRNAKVHRGGGAGISIIGGSGHRILDSEFAYMAQQGYHIGRVTDSLVARNRVHHNNPNHEYTTSWEAGGGKSARLERVTFTNNASYANNGPGLWCDVYCRDVVYRGNRVHDNLRAGIFYEVSYGGLIEDNVLWGNDYERTGWWWPTQILVSSSTGTTVRNNVVASGWAGISVISQTRNDWPDVKPYRNNRVVGNYVIGTQRLIGWADPDKVGLFDPANNNTGSGNHYWHAASEPSACRFEWSGCKSTLSDFQATPAEQGAEYLTRSEARAILSAHGVPYTLP